jgi:hypothetical protein
MNETALQIMHFSLFQYQEFNLELADRGDSECDAVLALRRTGHITYRCVRLNDLCLIYDRFSMVHAVESLGIKYDIYTLRAHRYFSA